jgi:regulator of sigma E protease
MFPVIVFAHELGHFLLARAFGVRVEKFSIGFGKSLYKWTDRRGTIWKIGVFPFGGYVKIYGQSDTPKKAEEAASLEDTNVHFEHKKTWQKAAMFAAGPAFNFLFAILLFWGYLLARGEPKAHISIVTDVLAGSVAEKAEIKANDVIEGDVRNIVSASEGRTVALSVNAKPVSITPQEDCGRFIIGVKYSLEAVEYRRLGLLSAAAGSLAMAWDASAKTLSALGQMITGSRSPRELGGMITISEIGGRALASGFLTFIYVVALISLNLGLINLLPIPMLDGGYLLLYLVEACIRRKVPERAKSLAFNIGFGIVIALMIYANLNDILRLFGK